MIINMNSITLKIIETKTCLQAKGVTCMKTTKNTNFSTQNENKDKPNHKFKSWNKKNKNKNMTYAKQESTKILLQRRNKTRSWQENVPKIGVEQTKGNEEFYFYL